MNDDQKLIDAIDARTRLAGSNKMEILLFSLGTRETFGINVFKVREVTPTPPITRTPNMPRGVEGVLSLRGSIIPVVDLAKFVNIGGTSSGGGSTMMVTEFNRHTQGFLVHSVDRIIRVDWNRVRSPDSVLGGNDGMITAITELDDGKLVSILDVEEVIAKAYGEVPMPEIQPLSSGGEASVFFVDDSAVARREITRVLDGLGVRHQHALNGMDALNKLKLMAERAEAQGHPLHESLHLILADAEMPEMDGYVLTREIKSDHRFGSIPVVMHSSLSSDANRAMGKSVGVDAYVAKFEPSVLADTLRPLLQPRST